MTQTMTQGQLEAFLAAERDIRAGYTRRAPGDLARELAGFLKQLQAAGVRLAGADLAATLESFTGLLTRQPAENMTGIEQNGLYVRAAARVGLLPGVSEADVAGMSPHTVRAHAEAVGQAFLEATTTPKN